MTDLPDFEALLNMDAEQAVRPPAMPPGTYRAIVGSQESVISPKKNSPGVMFTFKNFQPQADVDVQAWEEYLSSPVIEASEITMTDTFWMSKKSMFFLKQFCIACGSDGEGKMKKLVADAMGQSVLITVAQAVSQRDGVSVYNTIQGYAKDE